MIKFLILCALIASSYAVSVRIAKGTNATEGEFPYVVSLRQNLTHVCGASILNENFILTSAQCVCVNDKPLLHPSFFSIQYGSVIMANNDSTRSIQVKKINCNSFDIADLIFDSAVLELESPIPKGDNWAPVKLSKDFNSVNGASGVIVGWGQTFRGSPYPANLQKLTVQVYPDPVYKMEWFEYVTEHHICLGAPIGGICFGDRGGALIVEGEQVGISSFYTDDCGEAHVGAPDIYSRVSRYYDWIAGIAHL